MRSPYREEGKSMKRLFAILAFLAGGVATELSAPLQCNLIHAASTYQKRRKGGAA
jgi:hypothetical protein